MYDKDPLGLYRALDELEQKHKEVPITTDQYQEWLAHPVTKRLHEEMAATAVLNRLQATAVSLDVIENRIGLIEAGVMEHIIDWQPRATVEGDGDE